MNPLRFILVGLGARSRIWRRVLEEHPGCLLVGLADPDPDRLAAGLAVLSGATGGRTLSEVAAQVDADVALLCTPPAGREEQVRSACEAGLAILAEKPLADSLAGAEAYVSAAAAAGIPLAVGLNFRYLEVTRALKKLLAGRLGPPEFGRQLTVPCGPSGAGIAKPPGIGLPGTPLTDSVE